MSEQDTRARAEALLRRCVHCGFCNATCPTYRATGDERDSPRGRLVLIRDLLHHGGPASVETTRHLDRCTQCYACMSTCPSGVNYAALLARARQRLVVDGRRPWPRRLAHHALGWTLPWPRRLRVLLPLAGVVAPALRRLPGPVGAAAQALPRARARAPGNRGDVFTPRHQRGLRRVLLVPGCVQRVTHPEINAATVRLLTRLGCTVVVPEEVPCCGALDAHLDRAPAARRHARALVAAYAEARAGGDIDAVVFNASGCGRHARDLGAVLSDDPVWRQEAARLAARVRDVHEVLADLDLGPAEDAPHLKVVLHVPCTLQYGVPRHLAALPWTLLRRAGFPVEEAPENGQCCGSAGVYSVLEPTLAGRLAARKAERVGSVPGQVVATANVGCLHQLAQRETRAVVHVVELLDWATGGPLPAAVVTTDPTGRG